MRALPERLAASKRPRLPSPPETPGPQSPAPLRKPLWRSALLICGIALTAVLGTFSIRPLVEDFLVGKWEEQLAALDVRSDPAPLMAQAAEQGNWGLRLLVAATASPNERANVEATRQLQMRLEQWAAEPNFDHSSEVETVVHHLSRASQRYSPPQLLRLATLIERLTAWPVSPEKVAMKQYLVDSELLVRRLVEVAPERETFVDVVPDKPPQPIPKNVPAPEVARLDPPLAEVPQPPVTLPAAPPPPLSEAIMPRTQITQPTQPSAGPPLMLEMLPESPSTIRRLDEPPAVEPPAKLSPPNLAAPQSASIPDETRRWEKWSDWQVIRLLQRTADAPAAEEELKLRGYQSRDVQIARAAADPEPAIRLKLTKELPRIPGIDARLWLRQLAEDQDREVRQAAAAILRTAYDGPLTGEDRMRR